jgi:hypothetical protein
MKNRTFRSIITLLIIASPLWWTSGCYTTKEVTRLSEEEGSAIEVVTKRNNVYVFKTWTHDGYGSISGEANWIDPSSPRWSPTYLHGTIALPSDSINIIITKKVNTSQRDLAMVGVGFVVLGVVLVFVIDQMHNSIEGGWF